MNVTELHTKRSARQSLSGLGEKSKREEKSLRVIEKREKKREFEKVRVEIQEAGRE